jgi:hypothetical protein
LILHNPNLTKEYHLKSINSQDFSINGNEYEGWKYSKPNIPKDKVQSTTVEPTSMYLRKRREIQEKEERDGPTPSLYNKVRKNQVRVTHKTNESQPITFAKNLENMPRGTREQKFRSYSQKGGAHKSSYDSKVANKIKKVTSTKKITKPVTKKS